MATKEPTPNDQKFGELERQHGECARLDVGGKMYVFRSLKLDEFEDYQDRARKADRPGPVNREVTQLALVHPTLEELQTLFNSKPAVASVVSDQLVRMAGAGIEFTVKKD
jgi:hypothetical protein